MQWGDAATWATAVATLAAVAAAIWAGLSAKKLLVVEQDRDEKDREDRRTAAETSRRGQARLVSVIPATASTGGSGVAGSYMDVTYETGIQNETPESISHPRIRARVVFEDPAQEPLPGTHLEVDQTGGRLLGHNRWSVPLSFHLPATLSDAAPHHIDVEGWFTDSAGVRWYRDTDHVLHLDSDT